jgi:hypothetical protein
MTRSICRIVLACCLGLLSGCGQTDSVASVAQEQIAAGNELASLLEGVKDATSLDAARPRIKTLWERLQRAEARMKALPPAAENQDQFEKYHDKLGEMVGRLFDAVMAIRDKIPTALVTFKELGIFQVSSDGRLMIGKVYDVTRPPTPGK